MWTKETLGPSSMQVWELIIGYDTSLLQIWRRRAVRTTLRSDRGRGNRCGGGGSWCRDRGSDGGDWCTTFSVDVGLGAFARDVSSFTAAVAGLSGSVQRSAVRGRAIARDVTEFSARIALHGLSLAVAGEVVWPATLVAGSWASTASKATAESSIASARRTRTTTSTRTGTRAGGTGTGGRTGAL